jgi:hypothetical protein
MMIIKKVGYFLEKHIEKIVFAIVGLVCIWLLIFRVLISPNVVSYGGRKFSPSEIDKHIEEQAKELKYKLNQPPKPKPDYVSRLTGALDPNDPVRTGIWGDVQNGFEGLLASAINGIDTDMSIPMPPPISSQISDGREYALPLDNGVIGEVTDVEVEHIRAAAYVPTQPVTEEVTYENAMPQPDDIDLVTVEAKFDVAELYRRFHESFDSDFVKKEWRDPCLAVPVFAAVQLQRQEQLDNGDWSDWLTVPRSKIDNRKRIFEIVENIDNLPPGGIAVRLLQFNDPEVKMDLLQPQTYQIASANEEWLPPSLHNKYVELKRKEKAEQRREEIEAKKEEEERERNQRIEDRRGSTGIGGAFGTRPGIGGRVGGTTYEGYGGAAEGQRGTRGTRPRIGGRVDRRTRQADTGPYGGMGPGDRGLAGGRQPIRGGTRARGQDERNLDMDYLLAEGRNTRPKPSPDDVFLDFEKLLITGWTDMSKMREPLTFWAYDDMVEPGKSYRYRIRLGVFNPIAGTNKFKQQSKSYKDAVILWSEFSGVTEPVSIPKMMYLFAKDIQEAAKMVTIQVSKYILGYWYSEDFAVRQGEAIGKVVESERPDSDEPRGLRGYPYPLGEAGPRSDRRYSSIRDPRRLDYIRPEDRTGEPESIDYSTGAVMVDAMPVNDWSGEENLRPRHYFDMLYSFDGTSIERMPISEGNWPEELKLAFNDIRSLQRETKEPLRDWGSGTSRRRAIQRAPTPGLEGYEGLDGMYDDMMYEGMMGGRRFR